MSNKTRDMMNFVTNLKEKIDSKVKEVTKCKYISTLHEESNRIVFDFSSFKTLFENTKRDKNGKFTNQTAERVEVDSLAIDYRCDDDVVMIYSFNSMTGERGGTFGTGSAHRKIGKELENYLIPIIETLFGLHQFILY